MIPHHEPIRTDTQFTIRQATLADAQQIANYNIRLAQETEGKALDPAVVNAGVTALMNQPNYGFYLVAETPAGVVGTLMINFEWSDWRNGLFWWIQSVYVDADWRGQGVFRRLYQAVETLAAQQGNVCGLRLHVEHDNHIAQQTYQALGMSAGSYLTYEAMKN